MKVTTSSAASILAHQDRLVRPSVNPESLLQLAKNMTSIDTDPSVKDEAYTKFLNDIRAATHPESLQSALRAFQQLDQYPFLFSWALKSKKFNMGIDSRRRLPPSFIEVIFQNLPENDYRLLVILKRVLKEAIDSRDLSLQGQAERILDIFTASDDLIFRRAIKNVLEDIKRRSIDDSPKHAETEMSAVQEIPTGHFQSPALQRVVIANDLPQKTQFRNKESIQDFLALLESPNVAEVLKRESKLIAEILPKAMSIIPMTDHLMTRLRKKLYSICPLDTVRAWHEMSGAEWEKFGISYDGNFDGVYGSLLWLSEKEKERRQQRQESLKTHYDREALRTGILETSLTNTIRTRIFWWRRRLESIGKQISDQIKKTSLYDKISWRTQIERPIIKEKLNEIANESILEPLSAPSSSKDLSYRLLQMLEN